MKKPSQVTATVDTTRKVHLLTSDNYVREGAQRCPHCGGKKLQGGAVARDLGEATQARQCMSCGYRWVDEFVLRGYVSLTPPRK